VSEEGATFLAALSEDEVQALRERATTRKFSRGTAVAHAGQAGDRVIVVLSGHVKLIRVTEDGRDVLLAIRGPGDLVKKIRIPTLFVQGTVDTLFTLQEAITNYEIVKANGVPTKMLWFCGGHGSCLTDAGDGGRIETETLAWLQHYLVDKTINTGPGFDWSHLAGLTDWIEDPSNGGLMPRPADV